jgi:hypothetical protein
MNRLARIATALSVTTLIGMQIPTRNGVALAQNGGCSDNNGGKIFGVKGETIAAGAGVYIVATLLLSKTHPLPEGFTPSFSFSPTSPVLTDSGKSYVLPSAGSSDTTAPVSANGSAASLLEVSSGTARELIDRCPTLSKRLANEGPFTMFLPSDEALASVKLDGAALETFLKRHIVIGRYSYDNLAKLSDGAKLVTLAETELAVTHGESGEVLVGGVAVPSDAREGANGFSYAIKNVLP